MRKSVIAAVLLGLSVSVLSQGRFVDDAGRSVALPARTERVFAAGAPAEVMLYTLVPDRLVGRNRLPADDGLEFFPLAYRNPTLIRLLPEVDNPAADRELLALETDVYVDYGTVASDYIESVEAVQHRTGVPGIIMDGALARIPEMYRRIGTALGVAARGDQLATAAERLMARYRGALAGQGAPRVYIACSADGYVPCLPGDSGGEQLQWLGGVNAAAGNMPQPRRPLKIDEIVAMRPDVVIVPGAVARFRADPAWRAVDAVRDGRVHQWPVHPYGWGPRPPSVNRLPGLVWLAYVARGRSFDAAFESDIRAFFSDFYHLQLTTAQMQKLLAAG